MNDHRKLFMDAKIFGGLVRHKKSGKLYRVLHGYNIVGVLSAVNTGTVVEGCYYNFENHIYGLDGSINPNDVEEIEWV